MTVCILAEKNSAARNFATALGGASGTYDGVDYVIVAARGHLYEYKQPHLMVPADKQERYRNWGLENLPWDERDFSWERELKPGVADVRDKIAAAAAGASEIAIATDIDPTGEGGLLAWEIIDALNLHDKTITRMEFTDEAPASVRKAFSARRPVESMWAEGEFRKAEYRSRFDLLTMQSTRMASRVCGRRALLRNGRLKSAINLLVGDQIVAHENYRKVPFFEPRYRDDAGVEYVNRDVERHPTADAVPMDAYGPSAVVADGVTQKKVAPPKLLELSGLSAILSRKGYGADAVLTTYQKMYESQVVSYPRTEDKFVTPEQFSELEPKIDAIAAVVGVDPAKLTHRTPRRTHVKTGGAHGANRPGPNVPDSLDAVEMTYGKLGREIYDIVAKNYLTMLAPDYVYDRHAGHIKDHPEFTGSLSVPVSQGWKDIFDADAAAGESDDDGDGGLTSLGTTAEPFVHEGVPPRPPWPTMVWLMKQLETRDIGTGATRVSTFSEMTRVGRGGKDYSLLREKKGKISLTELGEMNHRLLPGTRIGDLQLTADVYADMRKIAEGTLDIDAALAPVKDWIRSDIAIMTDNARTIPDTMGATFMKTNTKPKFNGIWQDTPVNFNRVYAQHHFTDEECLTLCEGGTVDFTATSRDNQTYEATAKLARQSFVGDDGKTVNYIGISATKRVNPATHASGTWGGPSLVVRGRTVNTGDMVSFKRTWGQVKFTDEQIDKLLAGETIEVNGRKGPMQGKLGAQSFKKGNETIEYFGFGFA